MKKIICIMFTLFLATALFACSKEADSGVSEPTRADTASELLGTAQGNNPSETVVPSFSSEVPQITEQVLCSLPTKPVESTAFPFEIPDEITGDMLIHFPMVSWQGNGGDADLYTAYTAMKENEKFKGATVKNYQRLTLGEIGDEPCVRILLETDKGDFVAVMTDSCEVISTWSEGETKTVEFWFPQLWDATNASDENLSIAYHTFRGDEHYKDAIICDFEQKIIDNGSCLYEVTLKTTKGDFKVLMTEYGEVVDRTK